MKFIHTTLLFFFLTLASRAGDPAPVYVYKGEVAGVMCSACSKKVKTALGKIQGVLSVTILAGDQGKLPKLEITSTSPVLTREAAVKALGEDSKMYDIPSLKRVEK